MKGGIASTISAIEFANLSPAALRLAEARHLFKLFKSARNAEVNYGSFLLTTYFDALLFCLVSVEEMVEQERKKALLAIDSFLFLKALRNIATHHCVLSGIKGKFERPVVRLISVGVGTTVPFAEQFILVPEKLEIIFSAILSARRREARTIDGARRYLATLQLTGEDIFLVNVVEEALTDVGEIIT